MKGLIILGDSFEDTEALSSTDVLIRAGEQITRASVMNSLDVLSQCKVHIKADISIDDVKESDYDYLIIPGGKASFTILNKDARVEKLIDEEESAEEQLEEAKEEKTVKAKKGKKAKIEEEPDSEDDEDDDSASQADSGPDPELVKQKFTELRIQYEKVVAAHAKKGSAAAKKYKQELQKLSEMFSTFRLVPQVLDSLLRKMHDMMDRVKNQDHRIREIAVNICGMKLDELKALYTDSEQESDMAWFDKALKSKKPYVAKLKDYRPVIEECVGALKEVETESGISIARLYESTRGFE